MGSSDVFYNEKRNFIRMTIPEGISARLAIENEIITGECRDLSGGGLLVYTTRSIPEGTELLAEVSSRYGHAPVLKTRSRVVRNNDTGNGHFELGLETLEILNPAVASD